MIFNQHSDLQGQHSRLSASKYHWIFDDDEKFDRRFFSQEAAIRGSDLHKLAHDLIRLGVKLPDEPPTTMGMYVNDAIGFGMSPEVVLFYSKYAFATADAISFKRKKLRIHDLKTGISQTSEHQLEVYAAYFCLEYRQKPHQIEIELRIYQNNEARIYQADPDVIAHIMDTIKVRDKRIKQLKLEA